LVDAAPADGSDPVENFRLIEKELAEYSPALAAKPRLIVANKIDVPGAAEGVERLRSELNADVPAISGLTGRGLPELLVVIIRRLEPLKNWTTGWNRNKQPGTEPPAAAQPGAQTW
jgi:GTP-binding protein